MQQAHQPCAMTCMSVMQDWVENTHISCWGHDSRSHKPHSAPRDVAEPAVKTQGGPELGRYLAALAGNVAVLKGERASGHDAGHSRPATGPGAICHSASMSADFMGRSFTMMSTSTCMHPQTSPAWPAGAIALLLTALEQVQAWHHEGKGKKTRGG